MPRHVGERRVAPEHLEVARELLDGLDRADALDLDRDPAVVRVAAHQVDGADLGRPLAPDEAEPRPRARRAARRALPAGGARRRPSRGLRPRPARARTRRASRRSGSRAGLRSARRACGRRSSRRRLSTTVGGVIQLSGLYPPVSAWTRTEPSALKTSSRVASGRYGVQAAGVRDLAAGDDETHGPRRLPPAADVPQADVFVPGTKHVRVRRLDSRTPSGSARAGRTCDRAWHERDAFAAPRLDVPGYSSFDARGADDRLGAVVEAHEELALAVVVGRGDEQRPLLPATRQRPPSSPSSPRQKRTNGLRSHSRPIVVSSVCPGRTRMSGGSVISRSITDSRTTSAGPPPTASRKSVSPEKQRLAVDDEGDAVVGVARGRDRLDPKAARLERPGDDGDAETSTQLVLVLDVVGVAVCAEDVRRRQPLALDASSSGSSGAPLSTKTATPPGSSPRTYAFESQLRVHRPLDDHPLRRLREPGVIVQTRAVTRGLAAIRRRAGAGNLCAPPRSASSSRSRSSATRTRARSGSRCPVQGRP